MTDGVDQATGKAPVLPWLRVPVELNENSNVPIDDIPGLDERLRAILKLRFGYQGLFPIQAHVWQELGGGKSTLHDLCIAVPTGSGKTIAYALPMAQALARPPGTGGLGVNPSQGLRGLVVVPTHDLAVQVQKVLQPLGEAVGLRVVVVGAAHSVPEAVLAVCGLPGGPQCGADIVVTVPGRLVALLQAAGEALLAPLRFLVVDETDRLMKQSYQDWVTHLMSALDRAQRAREMRTCGEVLPLGPKAGWGSDSGRVLKLVVSATLTYDPAKLSRLCLHQPRYISFRSPQHLYRLPRTLHEFRVVCRAQDKPLMLLVLLEQLKGQATLVFASSLETTHKLLLLISLYPHFAGEVVEVSSLLPQKERESRLQGFQSGQTTILVASDTMTRGMDLDNVQNVVNYDSPVYAKTYVHRAGRTARAGKGGRVFTLLKEGDVHHFKKMLRKVDNRYVREYKFPAGCVEPWRKLLGTSLTQVQELLDAEQEI